MSLSVHFSPKGGCEAAVKELIGKAKVSLYVAMFTFSDILILDEMFKAQGRGVKVGILLDSGEVLDKYSVLPNLKTWGLPFLLDYKHTIMHNKYMIVDGLWVATGSYNYTHNAERANAENLLIVRNRMLAQKYVDNFFEHWSHSEPPKIVVTVANVKMDGPLLPPTRCLDF